jgi:hypothetical protein
MSFEEPIRFTSKASDAPSELQGAIRASRQEQGSPAEIAALRQRLARVFATRPPPASGSAWRAWAVGISLLGSIAWFTATRLEGDDAQPTARLRAPAARQAGNPPPVCDRAAPAAPAPDAAAAPPPASPAQPNANDSESPRSAPAKATRSPRQNRAASIAGGLPKRDLLRVEAGAALSELRLLKHSQAALENLPARALALAEEHQRLYPDGIFAQEREVLAIEALFQLHEQRLSAARARRFLTEHADSPHVRRVRSLLQRLE